MDAEGRVVDPSWKNTGRAYVAVETFASSTISERVAAGGSWDLEVEQVAPSELWPTLRNVAEPLERINSR